MGLKTNFAKLQDGDGESELSQRGNDPQRTCSERVERECQPWTDSKILSIAWRSNHRGEFKAERTPTSFGTHSRRFIRPR